jgi:tripartite-type tricarboxylate transporter receptor subunit TctC
MDRRQALVTTAALAAAGRAFAQPKTTRLVVTFTPGGPVDQVARVIAEPLARELGRPVVVENKPGANGAIGAVDVMKAEPDGGSIWFTSVGAVAINPALYDRLPYDMARDFSAVSKVVDNVELLVVNPANPARDAAEFVAAAKARAEPVPMASSGTGSIPHLAIEQLADRTGAKLLHVPYKGAAPAITDLMGGQVAGFFGDIPGLIGHVRAGRLRALGIASPRRHPALPDVRTLEEQGIHGVDTNNWYALFVSSRVAPAVIDSLNKAVRAVLATPAIRERLLQAGAEPAPSTPQEMAAVLRQDTDKWARLIRAKNIKAE